MSMHNLHTHSKLVCWGFFKAAQMTKLGDLSQVDPERVTK